MYAEASSQCGGTSKDEEGVESIKCDGDDGVAGEAIVEGRGDEVEERQDGKDGHKHVVVDCRGVAREGLADHGADKAQDDDHEEELQGPQAEIDHA